jgi:hypothetical protein
MNTDRMYGHNPLLFRHKPNVYDPEEFNNRANNYVLCWDKFRGIHYTLRELRRQLEVPDIDKICHEYRKSLIDFVEKGGLRYENVYAPLNNDLEKLYK